MTLSPFFTVFFIARLPLAYFTDVTLASDVPTEDFTNVVLGSVEKVI